MNIDGDHEGSQVLLPVYPAAGLWPLWYELGQFENHRV